MVLTSVYQLVRQAIIDKASISATYDGRYRELTPHVIGTKNGRQQVLCYQFGGESSSGLAPDGSAENWRCVWIGKLDNVVVIEGEPFHSAPNHSRPQTCVDVIDVEVIF